ncbi:MAG: ATP-binding protein [Oscillospiraceae bacterium]|nr:ATP-binding protein [Oscillospiraceae bacterium]
MAESKNVRDMEKNRKPIRRITIDNFGAIGSLDLRLDRPLQIVIGPQASGKSTLGKSIYFCRKIRDYFVDFAGEVLKGRFDSEYYLNFQKFLRNPFMGCFGTTKHMDPFVIRYFYDDAEHKFVAISLDRDSYATFQFSESIRTQLENTLQEVVEAKKNMPGFLSSAHKWRQDFLELVRSFANKIFVDDERLLYIPAGRNLLATIPDLIQPEPPSSVRGMSNNVDIRRTDLITQDFITYILEMKGRFGSKLEEITQDYLKTVKGQIRNKDVALACELIRRILKADYIYDKDGTEKLYYADGKWVKLMFGSSGQQEVLWALNCIFLVILQNEKTFLVFEEPESHIFPDAQESIAELVALMIYSSGSEVFLTTHSPYMLTAFNLLIYSGRVERSNESPVVEKQFRLGPQTVAAYLLSGSKRKIIDLIDSKRGLIDALQIDGVSDRINARMDALLERQLRAGKRN